MSISQANFHIAIFSDGACLGNPGPGGWAALVKTIPKSQDPMKPQEKSNGENPNGGSTLISGGEPFSTNNRMELMGALAPLETLPPGTHVTLTTDSQYVQKGLDTWLKSWKKKGWRTAGGGSVKNKDLWLRMDEVQKKLNLSVVWVKGHNGHPENELVDKAAQEKAREYQKNSGHTP